MARLLQQKEDQRNGPHDDDDRDLNFRSQRKVLIGRIRLPPSPPLSTSTWPSRLPRSFTEIRFALRPLLTNDRRARARARWRARFGRWAKFERRRWRRRSGPPLRAPSSPSFKCNIVPSFAFDHCAAPRRPSLPRFAGSLPPRPTSHSRIQCNRLTGIDDRNLRIKQLIVNKYVTCQTRGKELTRRNTEYHRDV